MLQREEIAGNAVGSKLTDELAPVMLKLLCVGEKLLNKHQSGSRPSSAKDGLIAVAYLPAPIAQGNRSQRVTCGNLVLRASAWSPVECHRGGSRH